MRDAAWLFLLNNNVCRLPLDIEQIVAQNDWVLLLYEENIKVANALLKGRQGTWQDGITCVYKGFKFIIYRKFTNLGRWRFTIAHEFGHITLLHLNKLSNEEYEREANMFAARVLMPMCVIKECKAYTFRAERLQMLLKRNKFYTSALEVKLVKQFKMFIKEYLEVKNGFI